LLSRSLQSHIHCN